ncbi:MAG: hypothetical protein ACRDFS_04300 [Chloroflexota bacterium]
MPKKTRDTRQQRRQQARRAATSGRKSGGKQRSWGFYASIAAVAIAAAIFGFAVTHESPGNAAGPAATSGAIKSLAPPVDGIKCGAMEALAYHIHQHLTLYDNGKQVAVPSEIGMVGHEPFNTCFYWIHVHEAYPNIIHVESPVQKTFHLGNFFDLWKATKSNAIPKGDAYVTKLEAAEKKGDARVYYNGKPWHRSYRAIPLKEHGSITIEIGKPVIAPKPYTNWQGL